MQQYTEDVSSKCAVCKQNSLMHKIIAPAVCQNKLLINNFWQTHDNNIVTTYNADTY